MQQPQPTRPAPAKLGTGEDIDGALPLDLLSLEVGYLVQTVDPQMGGTLVDRSRHSSVNWPSIWVS
jgi:hypothetical protein